MNAFEEWYKTGGWLYGQKSDSVEVWNAALKAAADQFGHSDISCNVIDKIIKLQAEN